MSGLVKVNISGATLWAEALARWKRVVPSTFNTPEFDSCFRKVHHQRLRILYHKIWHNKHQKRRISLFSWSVDRISEPLYRCFFSLVCFRSCWEISFFKFINITTISWRKKRHNVLQRSPDSKSLCFVCLSTAVFLWLKLYSVNTYSCLL